MRSLLLLLLLALLCLLLLLLFRCTLVFPLAFAEVADLRLCTRELRTAAQSDRKRQKKKQQSEFEAPQINAR